MEFPSPPPSHPVTAVVPTVTPIIVPYVECAGGGGSGTAGGGCCASTITVSVAGCHSSLGGPPSEWCPPSFDSRPDLAAINASGCLWALHEIWQEVQESGQAGATTPLVNGYNGNGHPLLPSATPLSPMRWVLCANLEASPSSPAYQIFCDGYPSDESIARLRAVRNIHLRNNDFLDATVRTSFFNYSSIHLRFYLILAFLMSMILVPTRPPLACLPASMYRCP